VICPYCGEDKDKVIDSRASDGGVVVRRRRECLVCQKRYTTYERVERAAPLVERPRADQHPELAEAHEEGVAPIDEHDPVLGIREPITQ
jgi:transcriptional regulator NrdR family protein